MSGDDDLYRKLISNRGVPYRRKRKHKGETWGVPEIPTIQEIHRGVWCPKCKVRHPYNGSPARRLGSAYEQRGKAWYLMWLCPVSGNIVGEVALGDHKQPKPEDQCTCCNKECDNENEHCQHCNLRSNTNGS